MNNKNNNNSCNKTRNLHNPQAHISAIYFPNWLSQVPISKLSMNAKVIYGRLCQWANTSGRTDRSTLQLCEELGMTKSPVDRALKELRTVGLIGTYQVEKGGVNHFEFYEHEWMTEQISRNLTYSDPTPKQVLPHTSKGVTPTPKWVSLKYININNNINNKGATSNEVCKSPKNKCNSLTVDDLLNDNPHALEKELIEDWIKVRKGKRAIITTTAWRVINLNLTKIKNIFDILPSEAFTRMVASGWLSLKVEYFEERKLYGNKKAIDNNDMNYSLGVRSEFGF